MPISHDGMARALVAVVALLNFGGLVVDSMVPFTSRMHLWNPAWKPHAKFHNAQTMTMGVMFGTLTLLILFALPTDRTLFLIAVATAGIYFWSMLIAQFFPGGVAWIDPEFEAGVPRVLGLHQQQFVSLVVSGVLIVAVVLAIG